MKKLLAALLVTVALIVVAVPANAEIKTFEGVGETLMSDDESLDAAQQRAKEKAVADAQAKVGVYVKSFLRVTNSSLTDKDIFAITQKNVKVTKMTRAISRYGESALLVTVNVKATFDSDEISKWLSRNEAERKEIIADDKDLKREIADRDRRIAELERQLAEQKKLEQKPAEKPATNQQVGGQIFEGVGKYRLGSSETLINAERGARILAMQNALERAGILLSSYSQVKDFALDKDIITTKSRAVLKVLDVKPEWIDFVCHMTVKVEINVAELNKWLAQEASKSK